jgi:hypothetical protein
VIVPLHCSVQKVGVYKGEKVVSWDTPSSTLPSIASSARPHNLETMLFTALLFVLIASPLAMSQSELIRRVFISPVEVFEPILDTVANHETH